MRVADHQDSAVTTGNLQGTLPLQPDGRRIAIVIQEDVAVRGGNLEDTGGLGQARARTGTAVDDVQAVAVAPGDVGQAGHQTQRGQRILAEAAAHVIVQAAGVGNFLERGVQRPAHVRGAVAGPQAVDAAAARVVGVGQRQVDKDVAALIVGLPVQARSHGGAGDDGHGDLGRQVQAAAVGVGAEAQVIDDQREFGGVGGRGRQRQEEEQQQASRRRRHSPTC